MLLKEIHQDSIYRYTYDTDMEYPGADLQLAGRALKQQEIQAANAAHKPEASDATRQLVDLVKQKLKTMYKSGWVDVVYRAKHVTITVSHPSNKDVFNPTLPTRNSQLLTTYGVKHRVVGDYRSIIYYVPYQD